MKDITYDDLCTIERDSEDRIRLIKMNSVAINNLNSHIALDIQEKLNDTTISKFYIKLGSFTGIKLISGRGPNVEVRMSTIGEVTTEIKSEFEETGINQTLHRVYLQVDCQVTIVTPYNEISKKISNQVLLIENVIIGNIPSTYLNID